jgi:carbon storage regulator
MLVLSRKAGQELLIGDDIRITVNRVSGNRVTLGISAPEHVRIIRSELESIVRSFDEGSDSSSSSYFVTDNSSTIECARQLQ